MANTFKFGNGNWAVKDGAALAYNDENNNFKPLPFTFTRSSSATRVNKEGLIEVIGQNKPRIDFLNNTSGHLMLEPSRTNMLQDSEDFTNSTYWLVSSMTVTSDNTTSPYGTQTADKVEATGAGSIRTQPNYTVTNGYSFSIFVKKGNSRYVTLRSFAFTTSAIIGFDLDNESAQTGGVIEKYPNDWYRLSISKDVSSDADKNGYFYMYLPNSLGSTTTVSGNYAYFWGAQLEDATYPTSYIPTSGSSSSVTRSDEYAIDAGNSSVFSDTELSWFLDIEGFAEDGTIRYISISDGGGSPYANNYAVQYRSDGNLRIFRNGLDYADAICIVNIDQSVRQKIAIRFKQNDMKVYINGVSQSLNGSYVFQSMSGVDTMKATQQNSSTSNAFDGKIYEMKVWNEGLSDSQLQALTS